MNNIALEKPRIVSPEEWTAARRDLLQKEKEFTRLRDQLSQQRRALPWLRVEKEYTFTGPHGAVTLADLFGDRSQLIIYHFMLAPGWGEGCTGCSFVADHVDSARQHFEHHDLSFAAVSRAPWEEIVPFQQRMGWQFPWVSSAGTSFNHDFHVTASAEEALRGRMLYNYELQETRGGEQPGASVFYRAADGAIYHTYSTYARGLERFLTTYEFIDLTPKGRMEDSPLSWVQYHDRY